MADPLTSTLRLTQPTVGGDSGLWGGLLNSDMAYIDAGVNGILGIAIGGLTSYTLLAAGDSSDQARYQWYNFTGALSGNCTITLPANKKIGRATNATTGGKNVILTNGGGTTVTLQPGQTFEFYSDGTNCALVPWGSPGIVPAVAVSGITTLTVSQSGSFVELSGGAGYTTTLPTPVGNAGIGFFFLNNGSASMTLSTPAGLFAGPSGNGASSATLYAGVSLSMVSDGTNWICYGLSSTGLVTPVVQVSGVTTLTSSQGGSMIELTGGAYTVTLPNPTTYTGWTYIFYNNSASTNTLSTPAGKFNGPLGSGASTVSLTAGVSLYVISDGSNWIAIDGQVSTTASPGVFTTLSASSTVSGAGFTALFASPPPIGSTTPNTGAFTTLSASSTVSGSGFSTYLASPPAIGGTAAAAGTFNALTLKGATNADFNIDTTGASNHAWINFKDQGISKWTFGKDTDSTFLLYDQVHAANVLYCDTSGNLTVGETGKTLTLVGSVTYAGSLTGGSGAFTTLSASSTVSGTGFANRFSSPGPIGNTAASTGAFTTLAASSTITPSTTAGIVGTTAADNAQAGSVGEYISSSVAKNTVNLSTATTANITSISLTAGDWDVSGNVVFAAGSGCTPTGFFVAINSTSATLPTDPAGGTYAGSNATFGTNTINAFAFGPARVNISSTTTYYLIGLSNFSGGAQTAGGFIGARRVR